MHMVIMIKLCLLMFVLLEEAVPTKEHWKCSLHLDGLQCALGIGATGNQQCFVGNWDILVSMCIYKSVLACIRTWLRAWS